MMISTPICSMDAELFIDSVIKPKCRRWRPKKILVSVSVLVGCWGISLDNVWQAGGEDRGGQADKQLHLSDPTSSQCWSATSLDHQWTFLLFLPASNKKRSYLSASMLVHYKNHLCCTQRSKLKRPT